MEYVIEVKNLKKSFDSLDVIKGCNLFVKPNEIYGFLGANGAGKTTVFKLIADFLHKDSGSIHILGLDMEKHHDEILKNIGISIGYPVFYEHLSAQQNLKIHLAYMDVNADIPQVLSMVGLDDIDNRPVSKFSLGMRARLAIARSIIHDPKILLLDEPLNGLDPQGIRDMRKLFIKLTTVYDKTILISSHTLSDIEFIADSVGILSNGIIEREAKMEYIRNKYNHGLEDYYFRIN